ncbi:MAG: DUF1761 domain-containing protein [Pseudomonadota bacterium]
MALLAEQWVAIVAAAFTAYMFGAFWYGVLATAWLEAVGKSEAELDADGDRVAIPYIVAFLAALLSAAGLAWLIGLVGLHDPLEAAAFAGGVGAVIVSPWIVTHYGFGDRSTALWWIDCGHTILAMALMGAVVTALG